MKNTIINIYSSTITVVTSFLVLIAFAPGATAQSGLRTVEDTVNSVFDIVQIIPPLLFTVVIIWFFWTVFQFVQKGDDETKKQLGYAIAGVFVISSIWGIVAFIQNTSGIDGDATNNSFEINLPDVRR